MTQVTVAVIGSVVYLLFRTTLGQTVEVSKACYGARGLTCTSHNLRCRRGRIAIKETFYMDTAVCSVYGISNCVNVSSIPLNGRRYNFSDSELDSLYENCSTQSVCSINGGRVFPTGFSAIRYQCVDETIDMCIDTDIQRTHTSLIWKGSSNQNKCMCSISKVTSTEPTLLTLTALEMRNHCPSFTFSLDGETVPIPCSQFTSNRLLLNLTNWNDVTLSLKASPSMNDIVIWIGIQVTEMLNIVCTEVPTTTLNAVEINKACFGTQTSQLLCTRHDLRCSSGRIRIQETFYMDSSVCVTTGLTNCANINVSNIPLTGTKYNFSDTELNSVHRNCSIQPTCSFKAGRSGAKTFSVISYQCINETTQTVATVISTNSMLTARPGSNEDSSPKQTSETNNGLAGGMFAAGFFTGLGVAAIISGVVYFLYIRRRCVIKKPEPGPESLPPPAYTGLADLGPPDTYDVINRPEGETTSSEPCQAPVYQNVDNVS